MGSVFRGAFQCVCSMDDICVNILTNLPCPLGERSLIDCDGAIIASSHSCEDASLIQMKAWLKTLPRNPPLYPVGPLLPPGCGRHSAESSESEKLQVERDIQAFLKEMQAKHGEKSVVFVGIFSPFPFDECPKYLFVFRSLSGRSSGLRCRGTSMRLYKRSLTKEFHSYVLSFPYSFIDTITFLFSFRYCATHLPTSNFQKKWRTT